jgi:hypothetical protein
MNRNNNKYDQAARTAVPNKPERQRIAQPGFAIHS